MQKNMWGRFCESCACQGASHATYPTYFPSCKECVRWSTKVSLKPTRTVSNDCQHMDILFFRSLANVTQQYWILWLQSNFEGFLRTVIIAMWQICDIILRFMPIWSKDKICGQEWHLSGHLTLLTSSLTELACYFDVVMRPSFVSHKVRKGRKEVGDI